VRTSRQTPPHTPRRVPADPRLPNRPLLYASAAALAVWMIVLTLAALRLI